MKIREFGWDGTANTNWAVRRWTLDEWPEVDVEEIEQRIVGSQNRDAALLELTRELDAPEAQIDGLAVDGETVERALTAIESDLRASMELAIGNIERVAAALMDEAERTVRLPLGQSVTMREVPVRAAGIYAPGGRAAYPSSVLMCAIPARVAGVERIALATPPGPDGNVNTAVLAAAALCGVDEVYAVGGAQAIFALAHGTETIEFVDVVAGPGNAWVRAAKAKVAGLVAIDSLAGPSELMVIFDPDADLRWIALDLCAQAEHGEETPLVAVSSDAGALGRLRAEVERVVASRSGIPDAPLAIVEVPDRDAAVDFANRFVPEHLELHLDDATAVAERITTAGCVFAGRTSATAFGDYVAGSNHVLPTSGAGRFSGPLGPDTFRRKIATVEIPPDAAAKLAPHVDVIARAEGLPVHGESAMIRAEEDA